MSLDSKQVLLGKRKLEGGSDADDESEDKEESKKRKPEQPRASDLEQSGETVYLTRPSCFAITKEDYAPYLKRMVVDSLSTQFPLPLIDIVYEYLECCELDMENAMKMFRPNGTKTLRQEEIQTLSQLSSYGFLAAYCFYRYFIRSTNYVWLDDEFRELTEQPLRIAGYVYGLVNDRYKKGKKLLNAAKMAGLDLYFPESLHAEPLDANW